MDVKALTKGLKDKASKSVISFKKPTSDYYRLDMIVRKSVGGKMTEEIKTDYKSYISLMSRANNMSMTKYIHKLMDEDMERNKDTYKKLSKLLDN